jgi:predicted PurR-regulated permease PerM
VIAASLVVIIAGLRAASAIVLPFLASVFLAVFSLPILYWLKRLKVPNPLAVLGTMLFVIAVLSGIGLLVGGSVNSFTEAAPHYRDRLQELTLNLREWLATQGIDLTDVGNLELINAGAVMDLAGNLFRAVTRLLQQTATVLLTMTFILLEAAGFPAKLEAALGKNGGLGRFTKVHSEVQRYLGIKAVISLATGILVGCWLWGLGVDFPLVWALLAFLMNFIPTLGSLLAGVPAVLLALVQYGPGRALAVAIGYLVINLILGTFIEPHFMGRRFGLSTLVVFLSLVFWGWVWGPVGMLLSVPLTMILKILMENSDDFRWLAMLLDARPPEDPAAAPMAAGPSRR